MKPTLLLTYALLFFSALLLPGTATAQTGQIAGTVIDEATGDPIPGVNVLVEGTQRGAATGPEGTYAITDVEPGTYTLLASFIGYGDETKEGIEVQGGQTTTVDLTMQQEAAGLDEVVVVGYGEQQRRDLTGSVSSVSAEDIEEASPMSVDQALQGRVAGLQVTQGSAKPGGGATVRIRGTGSIQSGAEPLYVIDGVPISPSGLPGPSAVSPNPLSTINPQDIESVEVLKDASATAIYGARGANGVVLITTKRGRSNESQVTFSSSIGTSRTLNTYEVANASQLAAFLNEAAGQFGVAPFFEDPDALGEGTDWQDQVLRSSAMTQNHQLSVRAGGEQTQFALSGNFFDEEGVVINSGFRRYSFRANIDHDVSDRFRVGSSVSLSRALYDQIPSENGNVRSGAIGGTLLFAPFVDPYDEEGNYNTFQDLPPEASSQLQLARSFNPLAAVQETTDETIVNRVLGDVNAEFDLLENLYVTTRLGTNIEDVAREAYETRRIPEDNVNGSATSNNIRRLNVLSENLLKYNDTFAEVHSLDVTAGFTWQNERNESQFLANSEFVTDITRNDDIGAGNQAGGPDVGSGASEWTLLSYLGRVNYSFNEKYLLTLTGRYDGSSKFGADNKWGFFPSGAVGWRLIEEPFMQDQDVFSNLKVRASYGLAGNQEIGTYSSLSQLNSVEVSFLGEPAAGFIPVSIANPDLKWEISRQLDVGLEIGFFDQRLRATADYYRKTTEDLILPVTLPIESGYTSTVQNAGSVRNTGLEFSLQADLLTGQAGGLSWSTNANVSTNRNEVLDLGAGDEFFGPGIDNGIGPYRNRGSLVRVGEPIGVFFGYRADGVFNDQEEIDAHEVQPEARPGDIKILDVNNDSTITAADRTILGSPYPDFTFGWTNRFSYGGVSLSVFLQGAQGAKVTNLNLLGLEGFRGASALTNQRLDRIEDRWTPENRDAEFARAGYLGGTEGTSTGSDRYIQDASYIRLKNVTLGYSLPMERLGISAVSRARLYVSGRDLLTFTDYVGYSPDVNSTGQSVINRGYDANAYPNARRYTVGIDLTF